MYHHFHEQTFKVCGVKRLNLQISSGEKRSYSVKNVDASDISVGFEFVRTDELWWSTKGNPYVFDTHMEER